MPKSRNNIVTKGLSGKIDDLVFRQMDGQTIVSRSPHVSSINSSAQQAARNLFRMAAVYAKAAIANPILLQFYKSKAKKGQRPYQMAIADFCKPPEILEIDSSLYKGSIGDSITVQAIDNGRVNTVKFRIESNGNLLEEGDAIIQSDGLSWTFTCGMPNSTIAGTLVSITATDLAGRKSSKQFTL
jgi:hypothetical protein